MVSIISNSGHIAHGIKEFVLDTQNDLDNLPVDIQAGSKAYIIETGIFYILNSQGEWIQNMSTSNGSSNTGTPGKDGKSAYEIAVANGFEGNEIEWLASLKGEQGETGAQGPAGENGSTPTEEELNTLIVAALDKKLFGGKTATVSTLEDFNKVLANNESEVKITLNDDFDLTAPIIIPEGKKIVFKLGDNNITSTGVGLQIQGEVELNGGSISTQSASIQVIDGGKLTINKTEINSAKSNGVNVTGTSSELIINSGSVSAQEYGVGAYHGATITINGGTLTGRDNFGLGGNGCAYYDTVQKKVVNQANDNTIAVEPTNVTINDGIIEGQIVTAGYIATAIYWPNTGTLTVNGGEIKGAAGIVQRGGTINLNGGTITANGTTGVKGKAGDSRVVVGPYAIIFDTESNYPDKDNMKLNIGKNVILNGTDGDVCKIPEDAESVIDNRNLT